jgi:Gpi18-like mannosyltransferase
MTDIAIAQEPRWRAIVILLVGAAVGWAPAFFLNVPSDYRNFVLPWYQHIVSYGPIGAFAHPFSNYTPPYLYFLSMTTLVGGPPVLIIKTLSLIGAAWTVYATYRLLKELGFAWALEGALAILLLPTLVINVPVWGQADAFWLAPCLLAIAAACRARSLAMVTWAGLAFAFKAQAIFLAPFVVAVLLNRRSPWWHWLVPAGVYALAMLPAWLIGWPASDLLTVYIRQAQWVPSDGMPFVSTASNPWEIFWVIDYWLAVRSYWIGFLAAGIATAAYIFYFARRDLTKEGMLTAALLSATILPYLLPGMHERFFALAELTAFCWALSVRNRTAAAVATMMQLQFVLSFFGWVRSMPELTVLGAMFTSLVLLFLIQHIRQGAGKEGRHDGQHVGAEQGYGDHYQTRRPA